MDQSGNFLDSDKSVGNNHQINSVANYVVDGTVHNSSSSNQNSIEFCLVCGDRASGRHYGAISCEGCKGFFKRSIRKQLGYQCRGTMNCEVTKHHRNRCQFCRLQKCLASGMRSDSVQHERKPILDKKDYQNVQVPTLNGQNVTSVSNIGTTSNNNVGNFIYHQRQQQLQMKGEYNISSSGESGNNNCKGDTLTNIQLSASLNAFPVGFNFSELTQTLNKRALLAATAGPYQQSTQQETNFNANEYLPELMNHQPILRIDDDSMDNTSCGKNSLLLGQNLINNKNQQSSSNNNNNNNNITETVNIDMSGSNGCLTNEIVSNVDTTVKTIAAANLIQKHIDQNIITESLSLLKYLQRQYENKSTIICNSSSSNNNNNTPNNNSNNIGTNNLSNGNINLFNTNGRDFNNAIVKNELLTDDCNDGLSSPHRVDSDDDDDDDEQIDDETNLDNDDINSLNNFHLKNQTISSNQRIPNDTTTTINNNNNISNIRQILNNNYMEIPILNEHNIQFCLQPPNLVPSCLNIHYVCESGSRILFLSIFWLKKIDAYQKLNEEIQISLLRRHWVKLFVIGLAQSSQLLSIPTIIQTIAKNIVQLTEIYYQQHHQTTITNTTVKIQKFTEHTTHLNEFICIMKSLDIDEHEYAFIRLMCAFSPENLNCHDLEIRNHIGKIQEYALQSYKIYLSEKLEIANKNNNCNNNLPNNYHTLEQNVDERCSKILLRLMQLSALQSDIIEELFFSNLIGVVQIDNIIPLILKLSDSGVGFC